jgi:hypothetical protein
MSRGPDIGTRLARAIERMRPGVAVVERSAAPWASVTFSGARHRIGVSVADAPGVGKWIERLPEAEFAIPGHIVADLAVTATARRGGRVAVTIEALTVET